ncbi:MAG: dihydroorotase [Cyanobium sp.]
MAATPLLLRQVQVLEGPGEAAARRDVWIDGRQLLGWEAVPSPSPRDREIQEVDARHLWLAPPLVDPHSVLEDPWLGRSETLESLCHAAAIGGYGTVALLPWARPWRDRPERLQLAWKDPCRLLLWGSFTADGAEDNLALHAEQIQAGALGLAGSDHLPPLALLEKGLRLGEMGTRPVLLAPRDPSLAQDGFVRERVESLRAGWPTDPVLSETLPLQSLLSLKATHRALQLRLMNLSTVEALALLRSHSDPPPASVCWWHLLADSGSLHPADEGWRMVPSLGAPEDREALIAALSQGLLAAVAVHHQPLDAEEQLLPLDQRKSGMAGHGLALSMLWRELVGQRGWSAEELWQVLCWGPSRYLDLPLERLVPPTDRWILWDPTRPWPEAVRQRGSLAANIPSLPADGLRGRVTASGLLPLEQWPLAENLPC